MDKLKRRRKSTERAIRVGFRLGLLVFTGYLTVRLLTLGLRTLESRAGMPGGELAIVPLIALLLWTGWTARKEYTAFKEGETENETRQYRTFERNQK